jgi:hypothetical protein
MSNLTTKEFWSIEIPKWVVAEMTKEEREALTEDLRKLESGAFEKILVKYDIEF